MAIATAGNRRVLIHFTHRYGFHRAMLCSNDGGRVYRADRGSGLDVAQLSQTETWIFVAK